MPAGRPHGPSREDIARAENGSQTRPAATNAADLVRDERVREMSRLRKALIRPELGAICGAVVVFVFFLVVARGTGMFAPQGILNWGVVAAQFAVIAVGACLLMIAGEFDLSVGSMIGFPASSSR